MTENLKPEDTWRLTSACESSTLLRRKFSLRGGTSRPKWARGSKLSEFVEFLWINRPQRPDEKGHGRTRAHSVPASDHLRSTISNVGFTEIYHLFEYILYEFTLRKPLGSRYYGALSVKKRPSVATNPPRSYMGCFMHRAGLRVDIALGDDLRGAPTRSFFNRFFEKRDNIDR